MSCSSPDQWTTFLTRNAYEFLDMLAIRCFIVFSAHINIATRAILVCRFASFRSMAMHVDYVVSRIFEAITAIWILNRIKLAFGCLRYPFFYSIWRWSFVFCSVQHFTAQKCFVWQQCRGVSFVRVVDFYLEIESNRNIDHVISINAFVRAPQSLDRI